MSPIFFSSIVRGKATSWSRILYSLRPKILVIEMDVSRCILVLDTSISAMSNLEQREYITNTGYYGGWPLGGIKGV